MIRKIARSRLPSRRHKSFDLTSQFPELHWRFGLEISYAGRSKVSSRTGSPFIIKKRTTIWNAFHGNFRESKRS